MILNSINKKVRLRPFVLCRRIDRGSSSAKKWLQPHMDFFYEARLIIGKTYGNCHLTGTVAQLMTEEDPQIENIFHEGLSHTDEVSKRYYRGNIASRLIQGFGIPLLTTEAKQIQNHKLNRPKTPQPPTTLISASTASSSTNIDPGKINSESSQVILIILT